MLEFNSLLRRLPGGREAGAKRQPRGRRHGRCRRRRSRWPLFSAPEPGAVDWRPPARRARLSADGATEAISSTMRPGWQELAAALKARRFITFDVETTGTDAIRSDLVGIALAVKEGEGYYIPVGHVGEPASNCRWRTIVAALQARRSPTPRFPKYGHNLKYDYIVLARYGLRRHPARPLTPCWANGCATRPRTAWA